MFRTLSPVRSAAVFYVLSLAMVTGLALAGAGTFAAATTPLIAVLLMLLVVTREGWRRSGWAGLGLHRLGARTWPLAVLAPLAIIVACGAVAVSTGIATWAPTGQAGAFSPLTWPAIFAINVLYAALTSALFEEIGWRGYFVPRLAVLGERRAMVLSGFLHGLFHLPVVLFTSLYLSDGSRWVVIPLFLAGATAFGVFTAWLRLRTDSVWPAVLAHAVHNVAFLWSGDLLTGDGAAMEHLAGESGAVTLVLYAGLAAVLLHRAGRSPAGRPASRGEVVSVTGGVR